VASAVVAKIFPELAETPEAFRLRVDEVGAIVKLYLSKEIVETHR
jgi:hypothetical protein